MKAQLKAPVPVPSGRPRLAGRIPAVALAVLLCVGLVLISSQFLPSGIDWETNYRLASLAILSGESPYQVDLFLATPWSVLPLLPLAILPLEIGRAALFWISLVAFAYAAYRLGARPIGVGLFLLSPPVVHCLLNANVEWIPLLGCVLPPQLGLLLVMAKPQTGVAVAIFWVIEAWRKGGAREVLRISWPLLLVLLLSFLFFGFWPMRFQNAMPLATGIGVNASLWPYSLPVGLALVVASIRQRQIRFAIGASPCLSPYALFHTWSASVLALVPATAELAVAVVGLWILTIMRALAGGP